MLKLGRQGNEGIRAYSLWPVGILHPEDPQMRESQSCGFQIAEYLHPCRGLFGREKPVADELAKGNLAVGLMIMGIFIGIGTALGLVVGLGLN